MSKFFIEIGTSDFDTLIPLAKGGWKGIFVEPVEYLLDNLERIDGCEYVNAAITAHNGKTTINYHSNPEEEWHKGIGYVTDKNIIGDFIPHSHEPAKPSNYFWRNNFENVTKKTVDCMTLDKLIEKYDVKKIDFLKIDVEGMEHTILHSYSWKIKPKIMKIETKWVYRDEEDVVHGENLIETWRSRLVELGYLVYEEDSDWYCLLI